ncbi:MAG: cobaltochelatase subunit CobN [Rhodobacteraceae bacterium]|nr:cobaltochelatase subunit CobN [Paracoccaceae bacterium]
MHVIFRETHGLEETETPTDLGQSPADLVVLSYSDSDLGAFAEAWHSSEDLPTLRLANLVGLKHPLSVDTYIDQTLQHAKGILIRLIGGVPYWSYGLQQVTALAQERGIALAVLPADGRPDSRLDDASTLPASTLRQLSHLCDTGGVVAAQAALGQLAIAAGLYARPVRGPKGVPTVGVWTPEHGVTCPVAAYDTPSDRPRVAITFYRAYLTAADLDPIRATCAALEARGLEPVGFFVPSLKAPEARRWLERQLLAFAPDAIVNATAFSGLGDDGTSPLDTCGVPVFQMALATSTEMAWADADRGLSPADLAMHVVLPEVDGRILAGVGSFKEPAARDAALEYSRYRHRAHAPGIERIADRVSDVIQLKCRRNADKRIGVILSTYPGKDWQMAHAVGLDGVASASAILSDLAEAGYTCETVDATRLLTSRIRLDLADYNELLSRLPKLLQADLATRWGPPEDDASVARGAFEFAALQTGNVTLALQPERAGTQDRTDSYHDLDRVPRHAYVAFYLWLTKDQNVDAICHIGAHGTLEWLPGKAVALSEACWPDALIGSTPVVYPFIVNDPGEAAQAKRRIAAVTLGHVPPPMAQSGSADRLARLESLLDEFSNADGLDPKRRGRLQSDIRSEAQALGLEHDIGLDAASDDSDAIPEIDRFVCDVKDSQFGDGLHVYGRPDQHQTAFETDLSARAERDALLASLSGQRIAPGPSGSPYRGRHDVLPTGRNLFTIDPRAVPTRAAYDQGVRLADELIRKHLQDAGDWPKGIIVDLWGSATMRTAGEDFAMALHLLGVRPVWDDGSDRVSGIEVLPIAELDRPRIDVTLRVSGLFRDVFPTLSALYAQSLKALSARDEAQDWNPFAGRAPSPRVYGPAPGQFGTGMKDLAETFTEEARAEAGRAWLNASAWAQDGTRSAHDPKGIADRVAAADAFAHAQDLPETDLLLAADYATHEAGFAAAQAVTGGQARSYHLDNTDPTRPRARGLSEEIARVVYARATNPGWLAGMQRHGFRGAAEIAATLDHMAAFAQLADAVPAHLFDAYYEATLGDADLAAFLETANPSAARAMKDRFAALAAAGLWTTQRNSIRAALEATS